jgi:tetratricopeptide (TPR) repeat protein
VDGGGSQTACLERFADDLSNRYAKAFAAQSAENKEGAVSMYTSALEQVVMHEYAHHFLGHFARIRSQKITRIDAEFEADMFAVLNAVQAAQPSSAMYYFFDGLAQVERHTKRLATPDYESGACRANNVENITAFMGIAPIVLIDAAYGGGYSLQRNSPAVVHSVAQQKFAATPPALKPGACAHIEKLELPEAFAELKRLYLRIEQDVDFLFSENKVWDSTRAARLLRDLSEMSRQFRYMQGLAAKSMSLMLRKWGLQSRKLTPLVGNVDLLLEGQSMSANFESGDFGRLLLAEGLAMIQERTDLPSQTRFDRASSFLQNAVYYNPDLSEAWANLAIISFKRGDCSAASGFAAKASETLTPTKKGDRESMKAFADRLKELASNPQECKTQGAGYHPY